MRATIVTQPVLRLSWDAGLLLDHAVSAATFDIPIDTDNTTATSCALTTSGVAFPGVQFIVTMKVNVGVYPTVVNGIARQDCVRGSAFSAPDAMDAGGRRVGIDIGTADCGAPETHFLIATTCDERRLGFVHTESNGGASAAPEFSPIVGLRHRSVAGDKDC